MHAPGAASQRVRLNSVRGAGGRVHDPLDGRGGFAGVLNGLCDARGGAGANFDDCVYTRPCCVVASRHGRVSDSVVGATFALGRDVAAGPLVQCFSEADRGRVSRHTKCPPDPAQLRWPEQPRARGDCSSPSTAPQREME